ncbi:unnamed protein product [Meloidogyne enterolobii]|uniref:Uncharacterized protein n=1 Tax=Meloidogyne enterolobii TaxID=390850 RepID=A0ACB0Y231_MELEN
MYTFTKWWWTKIVLFYKAGRNYFDFLWILFNHRFVELACHADPGENEWQAAIREVKEESGIDANEKLTLIKDFKHEMFYYVNSELKRVCELKRLTIG